MNKKSMGCGTALVILLFLGGFVFFINNIAKSDKETSSSIVSEDPYAWLIETISPACRSVGISPSGISGVSKTDDWEGGEQYQFSFSGVRFSAKLNSDGSVNSICCGTNEMFSGGEVKIEFMNGFLVRGDGGTTQGESCEVNGIAMNVTGGTCSYVEVNIGYYDDNGVKITSGLDNVLNLKNGEQWRFKAYGFGTGIKQYKIESITWY